MAFYLRKFSRAKWDFNVNLEPSMFTADAITGCTRTNKNKLSIWLSETNDFNDESVQKLIVALATTMTEPASIDLIWLDPTWFESKGYLIEKNDGKTRYSRVNFLHRDIADLNHTDLAEVGSHIIHQLTVHGAYKKVLKSDLLALVYKWLITDGDFEIDDLNEKWHEPLLKLANKH
ncbi:hypothetical protein [Pantoea sp. AS-PWVM4]|uniref:hypothetical protein n=1 Tax=Pantoea sp. AS-PWVM4 TaxID=1332069 RepID=UPI00055F06F9|nr:hypothetical protein [Pantoea sp. AS-PWVM4]